MEIRDTIDELRSSGRLNPLARALLFLIAFVLLTLLLGLLVLLALVFFGLSEQRVAIITLTLITQTISAFVLVWWFREKLDRLSFSSLDLNFREGWLGDLFWGIVVGVVTNTAVIGIGSLFGYFAFVNIGWQKASIGNMVGWGVLMIFWMALVGLNEELVSRGYLLQNLSSGTNLPAGVILSSIIFAAGHFANPNTTVLASFNLVLAGVFFCMVYLVRQSLWAAVGAHFAWNFFQGYVFGQNVSGLDILARYSLFHFEPFGPDLATGGAFGPEGSVITTLVLLVTIGVLLRRILVGRSRANT